MVILEKADKIKQEHSMLIRRTPHGGVKDPKIIFPLLCPHICKHLCAQSHICSEPLGTRATDARCRMSDIAAYGHRDARQSRFRGKQGGVAGNPKNPKKRVFGGSGPPPEKRRKTSFFCLLIKG